MLTVISPPFVGAGIVTEEPGLSRSASASLPFPSRIAGVPVQDVLQCVRNRIEEYVRTS